MTIHRSAGSRRVLFAAVALAFAVAVDSAPAGAQQRDTLPSFDPNADSSPQAQPSRPLSPEEQATQGNALVARLEQMATSMRVQLDRSREQRDAVKVTCLDDKLSQVDVAIRSARERKGALQAAVSRHDAEMSNHEFAMLSVLAQRADQINAEANECVGEEGSTVARDTRVKVLVDPSLPFVEEPASFPVTFTQPPLNLSPPQCASCQF